VSVFVGRAVGTKRGQLVQFSPFEASMKSALLRMGYNLLDIDCLKAFANKIHFEE